jgi:hypothetical protein
MRQPTMADIARHAGVSRIAVSYALNDHPGVSRATRARASSASPAISGTARTGRPWPCTAPRRRRSAW